MAGRLPERWRQGRRENVRLRAVHIRLYAANREGRFGKVSRSLYAYLKRLSLGRGEDIAKLLEIDIPPGNDRNDGAAAGAAGQRGGQRQGPGSLRDHPRPI